MMPPTVDQQAIVSLEMLASTCLLSFGASFIIGIFWTNASIPTDSGKVTWFGRKTIVVLLTTTGTGVLWAWNAEHIGPFQGCAWVLGTGCGVLLMRRRMFSTFAEAEGVARLPQLEQLEIKGIIRKNLFQDGHKKTERKIADRLAEIQRAQAELELLAVNELHDFAHEARDSAVKYMAAYRQILAKFLSTRDVATYEKELSSEFRSYLATLLQCMIRMFQHLVGPRRGLWLAVRIRDEVNGENVYKTLIRVGKVDSSKRQDHTVDIPENAGLPSFLREKYESGRGKGVVILNRKQRNTRNWLVTRNDARKEDENQMAGPIMVKSWNAEAESMDREMWMILYINSPESNTFAQEHIDFFRCCTDVLSLFFSMARAVESRGAVSAPK